MISYIFRRLAYAFVMLVLVSFVSFVIIKLPPGDFLTQKLIQLRNRGDTSADQRIEQLRARYGLDKPYMVQYTSWVLKFAKGDFGESFAYERPVADVLGERVWLTIIMSISTLVVTWLIAIPLGVLSAVKQYTWVDQVISVVSFVGMGMPGFLLALIVLFVAVIYLNMDVIGLFSSEFVDAPWNIAKVIDLLKHLWLPTLITAVTSTGGLIRIMRGNLLDTLGQPFVEAARARGLKSGSVVWKHAVRIAINPLIVILGSEALPGILSGSALVSIVLNLPTIGPLYVEALRRLDMYMAGSCILIFTVLLLIGNLLSDLCLAWLDPRIRLD